LFVQILVAVYSVESILPEYSSSKFCLIY